MNLPKDVPIYDLKEPLPFISEMLELEKTKTLFGKKILFKLCFIVGDTLEQQSAAGKLSHSAIQCCRHCCLSKHDKGFNLGNKLIINDDSVENYLNSNVERKRDFNHTVSFTFKAQTFNEI
ncbi:hypothetical protein M0812_16424 [Anaeramoeba flamelloides]|uniref:Uncharacterized protein n=1 Tax=Anaeramoeba flamelloides TaxID=1746091 RepID=A0AAV7ZHI6_9EUKA|nr:hypothetical protein M0812_16424 [Anaeramoeba flamelloides]